MNCVKITCQHPGHGGITMLDDPKNEQNLASFMEIFRKRGCIPVVTSFDFEKPGELEK